jgi:hypothetical protein
MRAPAAFFALLTAVLLCGCDSDRGYFSERGYFPERHAAVTPAVTPLPLAPSAPVELVAAPARPSVIDERVPQRWPAAQPEPVAPAPEPLPARSATPTADPYAPVPAVIRRSQRPTAAPASASPAWRPPALQPKTPEVGSPEWQREQSQTQRRERDLNRTLKGICSGC